MGPGERIDNIGFGDLKLIQKPDEFCYGIDAVLLADFAAEARPDTVIDLGTGTGVIPLILSHKTDASKIMGIEVQVESYKRACNNGILNQLVNRVKFIRGDVADKSVLDFALKSISCPNGVDLVCSNPPYMITNGALVNKNKAKAIARHETTAGIEDFIKAAAYVLKDKGHFYLVHRPSRLVDIFYYARNNKLEPKEMRLVCPQKGATANIVLIHFVKNGGAQLNLLPELAVYNDDGTYTEEINKIYQRDKVI